MIKHQNEDRKKFTSKNKKVKVKKNG